jgi:hypothetical protein
MSTQRITPRLMATLRAEYAKTTPKPRTVGQQHQAAITVIDRHNPGDRFGLTGYAQSHRLTEVIREVIA